MGVSRKTKSVGKIIEIFNGTNQALSVVHLVDQLRDDMNKTTVYRALERLEDDRKIHSFTGADGLKWYASCNDCCTAENVNFHPHFQCEKCGKIEYLSIDLELPKLPNNYKIERAELLLLGSCDECIA